MYLIHFLFAFFTSEITIVLVPYHLGFFRKVIEGRIIDNRIVRNLKIV